MRDQIAVVKGGACSSSFADTECLVEIAVMPEIPAFARMTGEGAGISSGRVNA